MKISSGSRVFLSLEVDSCCAIGALFETRLRSSMTLDKQIEIIFFFFRCEDAHTNVIGFHVSSSNLKIFFAS